MTFLFCCLWVKVLGKVGRIARITPKKDVVVSFGRKHWVFNIACLRPCPGAEVDQIEEEEDLSLSIGTIFKNQDQHYYVCFCLLWGFFSNLSLWFMTLEAVIRVRGSNKDWLIKCLESRVFAVSLEQHGIYFIVCCQSNIPKCTFWKGDVSTNMQKKAYNIFLSAIHGV